MERDDRGEYLPFFWLDAYEAPEAPGKLYLFGKVDAYISCVRECMYMYMYVYVYYVSRADLCGFALLAFLFTANCLLWYLTPRSMRNERQCCMVVALIRLAATLVFDHSYCVCVECVRGLVCDQVPVANANPPRYQSCCLLINNVQRCLYVQPRQEIQQPEDMLPVAEELSSLLVPSIIPRQVGQKFKGKIVTRK